MSKERRLSSPRMTLVIALVLLGLLLVSLSPLVPRASATTLPGNTDALVNLGQPTRDSSSAIPIFGFSMTANASMVERLRSVTIGFNPRPDWQPGNDQDLKALSPDGRSSGVALYRDDGNDVLDANDVPITMASGPAWSGNNVTFDFTAGAGTTEWIPTSVPGRYQWFVVIRTSSNPVALINGETISATLRAGAIVASSGLGTVSQPLSAVNANDLRVDLTSGVDMVGASGFPWIGPATATVNAKAVMGIHVVDGGIAVNRGIQDSITSLQFRLVQTGGAISSGDFKPISTNPATSGIALYRDNGTVKDQWDPSDWGIVPATITPIIFPVSPTGATTFTMTFSPSLSVPHVATSRLDFFIVVRTAGIVTGDSFRIEIPANGIRVRGILGAGVDADLRTPMVTQSTSWVLADSTLPVTFGEGWSTSSNYLYASGLDLHFAHAMTSVQTAFAAGIAVDWLSGLSNATFKAAPSLASSPPVQTLSGGWAYFAGAYGFSNTSLATSSPADVTICSRVGICISTSQEGRVYRYIYETSKVIILPSPGWIITGNTPPYWIDPSTGKLWFSNLIAAPGNATYINVNVASLSGAPLTSISAPAKPSLGGPTPASTTFPAGTFSSFWNTYYTINATSNALAAPVTLTARDNFGNVGTANFDYGLDTTGPTISILNPIRGSIVGGNIVAKATIADDYTNILYVQFLVDSTKTYFGFFDGTNYFTPISTADFPDGIHRIQVQAWDMVGNQNTVGADVTFSNAAAIPPKLSLVTPVGGSYIQGLYTISASATDSSGVKTVNFTLRRVSDNSLVFSAPLGFAFASGLWQAGLDTTALPDGAYRLTVTAVNTGGLSSVVTVQIQVDNSAPILSVSSPLENAYISGTWAINATASSAFLSGITYSVDGGPWLPLGKTLDTTKLSDGHHVIAVRASDLSGKATTQSVDVTVANTPPTPPTAMQNFVAILPPLYFGFLVFAFVVAVLIVRAWVRPQGKTPWRHRREREPTIEIQGQPPNPPSPPPPGSP